MLSFSCVRHWGTASSILAKDCYTSCFVCVFINEHKKQLYKELATFLILRNKVGHFSSTSEQSGQASMLFKQLEID